ncbi:asparaginase [Aquabacterium sp.]|uniref:asparaginase n=1 Tax=Aquabacterium sp. TaxID=1872578 RepID=UPI002BBB2817|nr:asparaginase [Aquabacterium sp.]HSW05445.1 asparaginase [Aquabacterium sp.]
MSFPTNPDLVHALRGDAVESVHRGALAIVDADGALRFALGDITRPIFPRSAVKVLQALPLVASGAADAFGLSNDELALACASHGGEPRHAATSASMLAKAGLDAAALECGAHWPSNDTAMKALAREGREPQALHNNCSGKHAGFICVGCLMARAQGAEPRAFVRGYLQPAHPVMREITAALQATTGADLRQAPVGTDGCSIPTYGIPLQNLARAFARIGTGLGLSEGHARAARRLRAAVAASPFFVAGSGRMDTRVMERLGERVFCKVGAEGVYCAALPDPGLGVAIKMDDGNNARAAEVVMAAVIEALAGLDDGEREFLRGFSELRLKNWNGIEVGALRATAGLRTALAAS